MSSSFKVLILNCFYHVIFFRCSPRTWEQQRASRRSDPPFCGRARETISFDWKALIMRQAGSPSAARRRHHCCQPQHWIYHRSLEPCLGWCDGGVMVWTIRQDAVSHSRPSPVPVFRARARHRWSETVRRGSERESDLWHSDASDSV